ncbi:MAG: hypothetical protein GAK31_01691 [Stenotrophomonas maltophilia]|uniref:Transmembrane protein n=1 Tax=Stenotrophomonas maltophilia TaxID=40324 RepID=A0A7V8FI58_STEMA|nr:MAG: hypothetical protein GAK31_01691 [Stenotrophomonas maltophilia]
MGCEWIGWCGLTASEQASWVQAVGSVFAICIAVYVPWKQRRYAVLEERKKDRNRVIVMATALAPGLEDLRSTLATTLDYLEKSLAERVHLPEKLPRHLEFDQFRSDLYLFGPLGNTVNKAISYQQQFENSMNILRSLDVLPDDFIKETRTNMIHAVEVLGQCVIALVEISRGSH